MRSTLANKRMTCYNKGEEIMKKAKARPLALLLSALILAGTCLSCSNAGENPSADPTTPAGSGEPSAPAEETVPETEPAETEVRDDLGDYDFGGADFGAMTFENQNFHYRVRADEMEGTSLNDAMYDSTVAVEDRFNVKIAEMLYADFSNTPRVSVEAGDTGIDLVRIRCTDATTWWSNNLLVTADNVPVIDLSKPYWDKTVNDSLTIANQHYIALSAFDLCTYDLTFALMFNKSFIPDYGFDSPYDLVLSGDWTMDRMNEMMKAVSEDTDGNGVRDREDRWGYVAHPKMVAPGFWIGADALSVEKDEADVPHLAVGSEKFVSVWEKLIDLCYSENQYLGIDAAADIPPEAIRMFSENKALFMDMSFFFAEELRTMESDFGIIPYPKYDTAQDHYATRLCYYMPTVVPVTKTGDGLERCGVMLEALAAEYYNHVIPAYYDVVLQYKVARDEESQGMLDIIFASRVIDIGDSTLCAQLRDGALRSLFEQKSTNLASLAKSQGKIIDKTLSKLPGVGD